MKTLIDFPTDGNGSIAIEIDDTPPNPKGLMNASGNVCIQATQKIEDAIDSFKPAALTVIDKLRELTSPADSIELSFGIKFNADAGVVISRVGTEANFNIKMTWKKGESGGQKPGTPVGSGDGTSVGVRASTAEDAAGSQ